MRHIFAVVVALWAFALAVPAALAADGMLGVELGQRLGGVTILKVMPDTPAAEVGIQPGDVLVKVGTTRVSSIKDALDAKAAAENNVDVPFVFRTPGGLWVVNARFEKGQVYGKYSAPKARPTPEK